MGMGIDFNGMLRSLPSTNLAEMIHEQQGGLLDPGALPLAALDHDGDCVEVLLLGPGDDLHVVLVHDGPHVGAVGIRGRLARG